MSALCILGIPDKIAKGLWIYALVSFDIISHKKTIPFLQWENLCLTICPNHKIILYKKKNQAINK